MSTTEVSPTSDSQARHSSRCRVCLHPQRAAIERSFVLRTGTVADICMRFRIRRDSLYRHANALCLIEPRNRNWRGSVQSDNTAEVTTEAEEVEKTVPHSEKQSTPYARAMIEFLLLESDDDLLSAIEEEIQAKARTSGLPIDLVASGIQITAALAKIRREPDDWPRWFRSMGHAYEPLR